MRKKSKHYKWKLEFIRHRLGVRLDEPGECLDLLEKILEKSRPVIGNILWKIIDERYHALVKNNRLYNGFQEKYNQLIEKADELNKQVELRVREYTNPNANHHPKTLKLIEDRNYIKKRYKCHLDRRFFEEETQ